LIRKAELAHIWSRLLQIAADGHWHTRVTVAQRLGVAPERLRAALQQFLRMGAPLQCDVYRGLRFVQPVTPLRGAGRRAACLVEESFAVDSTNTQAMQALGAGLARRKAWVAEYQTLGRGRALRRWHQGLGCGLSLSLALPACEAVSVQALPLRVGLALAEALQRLGVRDVGLKWPNDVLVQGKKLAGILIEARPAGVVVGVGLNHLRQRHEGQAIGQATTSLHEILGQRLPARSRVLYEVLRAVLLELLMRQECELQRRSGLAREKSHTETFAGKSAPTADSVGAVSSTWLSRFARFDVLKDRQVRVLETGGIHWFGVAQGVDAQGYLRVMTATGMRLCHAGEVSVRVD